MSRKLEICSNWQTSSTADAVDVYAYLQAETDKVSAMTGSLEISAGDNPPDEINVIVEIPSGSSVKYEVDEKTGAVFVDRFLSTATHYPFNYGFIPQTREDDGDPLDVLVLTQLSVFPNTVIRSRPIGLLLTEDENGQDAKVIAAPTKTVDPYYQEIEDLDQIPVFMRNQIEHFFKHYKELEPTKFVRIVRWETRDAARKRIRTAMRLFQAAANVRAESRRDKLAKR